MTMMMMMLLLSADPASARLMTVASMPVAHIWLTRTLAVVTEWLAVMLLSSACSRWNLVVIAFRPSTEEVMAAGNHPQHAVGHGFKRRLRG